MKYVNMQEKEQSRGGGGGGGGGGVFKIYITLALLVLNL